LEISIRVIEQMPSGEAPANFDAVPTQKKTLVNAVTFSPTSRLTNLLEATEEVALGAALYMASTCAKTE
jgi:hypothetical protein